MLCLQQMTEAAVTRERAKLYAEVKENLLRQAASNDSDELTSLRTRQASALCSDLTCTLLCLLISIA